MARPRKMRLSGATMKVLYVLAMALLLATCVDTTLSDAAHSANQKLEAKGSPYRWTPKTVGDSGTLVLTLMPLPAGPSRANPALAQQVLGLLSKEEAKKGRYSAELQEVRYLNDGREVWVLHSIGDGVAYVVAMSNPADPRSSVKLSGPTTYSR